MPDDFYENHYEASIEDVFETNFDGTNQGHGDGKGKFGAFPGRSGEAHIPVGNSKGGNPHCSNEGVTDEESTKISGLVGADYIISGFTAIGSSCKDATSLIRITVNGPSHMPVLSSVLQGPTTSIFNPTVSGTYTITAGAQGQFGTRVVTVAGANAGADFNVPQNTVGQLDGSASITSPTSGAITGYSWTGPLALSDPAIVNPTFTAPSWNSGPPSGNEYTFTLTVTFTDTTVAVDTVTVTVTK